LALARAGANTEPKLAASQHEFIRDVVLSKSLTTAQCSPRDEISCQVAKERNANLRDFYLPTLSKLHSYHLIYIEESGAQWPRKLESRHGNHLVMHLRLTLEPLKIVLWRIFPSESWFLPA
jgi:hypothetical protein